MPIDFSASAADVVTIPDPAGGELDFNVNELFTLTCWVNSSDTGSAQMALHKRNGTGYELRMTNAPTDVFFRVDEGGPNRDASATPTVMDGNWHFIACGRDGTDVWIQVDDNTPDVRGDATPADIRNAIDFHIGNDGSQNWTGLMDDVRMYRRALSAAELATIYGARGVDGIVEGLAGRWLMNELSPGTAAVSAGSVRDLSNNGLNGNPGDSPTYGAGVLRFRRRLA